MDYNMRSLPSVDDHPWIRQALNELYGLTGDRWSAEKKAKSLAKYGRNPNVGNAATGYTLWFTGQDQAHEAYVNRNLIDSISGNSTSDVGNVMRIEGHTVGSDLSVSSLTQAAGTATCTTSTDHGYSTGDWVSIEGANESEYNGIVQITVLSNNSFSYEVDSGATSPATGTILSTNQNKTFIVQFQVLNGQNRVPLDTPLARLTTMRVAESSNAQSLVGDVFGYENTSLTGGKPTDTTKIHITVNGAGGKDRSEKASTTLSSVDAWPISEFDAGYLTKTGANNADVELQIRLPGGVFTSYADLVISTGGFSRKTKSPFLLVPPNSDVRLVAIASTGAQSIEGSMNGPLATIV